MSSIYHQSLLGLGGSISHSQLEGGSSHFLNINCPVVPLWPGLQLNFQLGTKDQLYRGHNVHSILGLLSTQSPTKKWLKLSTQD